MAENLRVAIVDGTGAWSNDEYNMDMRNSFCSQIARYLNVDAPSEMSSNQICMYQRGPSVEGSMTATKAGRSREFLLGGLKASNGQANKLILIGYSRGGAAAIRTAELLVGSGIKISAMFLFDPVARYIGPGGVVVPENVEKLWVVHRTFDEQSVSKYDGLMAKAGKKVGKLAPKLAPLAVLPQARGAVLAMGATGAVGKLLSDWDNPMRPGFGFAGTQFKGNQANAARQGFPGSHGALGGVGFANVTGDKDCQSSVAGYMTQGLHSMGIKCVLKGGEPTGVWD